MPKSLWTHQITEESKNTSEPITRELLNTWLNSDCKSARTVTDAYTTELCDHENPTESFRNSLQMFSLLNHWTTYSSVTMPEKRLNLRCEMLILRQFQVITKQWINSKLTLWDIDKIRSVTSQTWWNFCVVEQGGWTGRVDYKSPNGWCVVPRERNNIATSAIFVSDDEFQMRRNRWRVDKYSSFREFFEAINCTFLKLRKQSSWE